MAAYLEKRDSLAKEYQKMLDPSRLVRSPVETSASRIGEVKKPYQDRMETGE